MNKDLENYKETLISEQGKGVCIGGKKEEAQLKKLIRVVKDTVTVEKTKDVRAAVRLQAQLQGGIRRRSTRQGGNWLGNIWGFVQGVGTVFKPIIKVAIPIVGDLAAKALDAIFPTTG